MTTLLRMVEDPDTSTHVGAWVGDFHPYNLSLVDAQWSPVDITTGTLSVTFTDDTTGLPYTFPSGSAVLTKKWADEGLIELVEEAGHSGVVRCLDPRVDVRLDAVHLGEKLIASAPLVPAAQSTEPDCFTGEVGSCYSFAG